MTSGRTYTVIVEKMIYIQKIFCAERMPVAGGPQKQRRNPVRKYDTVLFDLDGTLIDSLGDMTDSVNYVMEKFSYPTHTEDEVRSYIGDGIRRLIERALPAGTAQDIVEKALKEYRSYYNGHCMVRTRPYEGIQELLAQLKAEGIRTAVVSNKNDEAASQICAHYFPGTVDVVIGQRDGVPKKPDPAMVRAALEQLGTGDGRAVYVGDSEVDILTAQNSRMDCITCLWGFRDPEFLVKNGAKAVVSSAAELLEMLK